MYATQIHTSLFFSLSSSRLLPGLLSMQVLLGAGQESRAAGFAAPLSVLLLTKWSLSRLIVVWSRSWPLLLTCARCVLEAASLCPSPCFIWIWWAALRKWLRASVIYLRSDSFLLMTVTWRHNIVTVLTDSHTHQSLHIHQTHKKECSGCSVVGINWIVASFLTCDVYRGYEEKRFLHAGRLCLYKQGQSRHWALSANSSLDNTAVATHRRCLGCRVKMHHAHSPSLSQLSS